MTAPALRPRRAPATGVFWLVVHRRESRLPDAHALGGGAWLELRADTLGDSDAAAAGSAMTFPGSVPSGSGMFGSPAGLGPRVYTLRSRSEGGSFDGSADERAARLIAAAERFDLIDLEVERDLQPRVLAAVPAARRVLSWSGLAADVDALCRLHRRMLETPAALYRIVPRVRCASEALDVLRFLHRVKRTDTIAYADGPAGFWTRPLAPRFGAPLIVADVDAGGSASSSVASQNGISQNGISQNGAFKPGDDLSWMRLQRDYGLPLLPPVEELYGILGAAVLRSPSPRLHNAGYRMLRRAALFVPFVQAEFEPFWRVFCDGRGLDEIGLRLSGLTVGAPHKGAAAEIAGACAPIVARTDSSNLLIRRGDRWFGSSTDPMSVLPLLCRDGRRLRGARAAVIGCGGSGRSIAAALAAAGAAVTLVNRHHDRGRAAAARLGLAFVPLADFTPHGFSVVVNATPIGRDSRQGRNGSDAHAGDHAHAANDGHAASNGSGHDSRDLPFEPRDLDPAAAVVDLVCTEETTPLVAAARAARLMTVDGHDVLAAQVSRQFRAMTGTELPRDVLERTTAVGRSDLAAALV